ncbi:hypothetical protein [Roseimicrobium sp. ORNL1]|uniref:hypothetical protein n=1 Tax=Roseimicrobium sp. ORNL1 TaxID=2711231 RepID=UPI0013E17772|nr:hypothetical protein [Roseimicrobium sp. ORNL1]QIF05610.1 hypothetical protein G5S37_30295 [Roseimicrobium sp. ORNL1]
MRWILILLALILGVLVSTRTFLKHDVVRPPAVGLDLEYPVMGLVMQEEAPPAFEAVSQNLDVLQQAAHLKVIRQHGCTRVTHLVLHLDCHYYFADNGIVYVTTWSSPGKPPRLVETRPWTGSPTEFDGYHTELLPEA